MSCTVVVLWVFFWMLCNLNNLGALPVVCEKCLSFWRCNIWTWLRLRALLWIFIKCYKFEKSTWSRIVFFLFFFLLFLLTSWLAVCVCSNVKLSLIWSFLLTKLRTFQLIFCILPLCGNLVALLVSKLTCSLNHSCSNWEDTNVLKRKQLEVSLFAWKEISVRVPLKLSFQRRNATVNYELKLRVWDLAIFLLIISKLIKKTKKKSWKCNVTLQMPLYTIRSMHEATSTKPCPCCDCKTFKKKKKPCSMNALWIECRGCSGESWKRVCLSLRSNDKS